MKLLVNSDAKYIPLKDGSVHCVVTSPPYFGLRDYGTAEWVGGDAECEHIAKEYTNLESGLRNDGSKHKGLYEGEKATVKVEYYRDMCKCGATRVDNQIGLEDTIEEYVSAMVNVGREIWRVLRDDGIWWLNIADNYAGSGNGSNDYRESGTSISKNDNKYGQHKPGTGSLLKPKDKMFIPERTAMALQADGWWVRRDIIWAKGCSFNYKGGSTMPESCKDRPTSSHEYVYLLTKSKKYYYDYYGVLEDAITEPHKPGNKLHPDKISGPNDRGGHSQWEESMDKIWGTNGKRNLRSVWVINTASYPGSHYAVFSQDLVEPMILAGCPEKVCPECGAPWERAVEKTGNRIQHHWAPGTDAKTEESKGRHGKTSTLVTGYSFEYETTGWQPTCACGHDETVPATVLDPFVGSGTTVMVANKLNRRGIGLDLSFEYLNKNARERTMYGDFVPVGDYKQYTIGV